MRILQPLLRSGPTVTAAVLPLALAAGPADAASGINVSTIGTTVSVTTSACARLNGSWGTGSLLSSKQSSFAQGRQVALAGTTVSQSAAWSNVGPGTYTVIVRCSNTSTAGSQSVVVSAASSPTISATSSPSRGVMGGLGGAAEDYGPLTLAGGGALVGMGVIGAAWFLRRRAKPNRL